MRGNSGVDPVSELADLWRIQGISLLAGSVYTYYDNDCAKGKIEIRHIQSVGCCTQIKRL